MLHRDHIRTVFLAAVILCVSAGAAYYIYKKEIELNTYIEHFESVSTDDFVWGTEQMRIELGVLRGNIGAYGDTYVAWDAAKAKVALDILYSRFKTIDFAINRMQEPDKTNFLITGTYAVLVLAFERLDTKLLGFLQNPSPQDYEDILLSIDVTQRYAANFSSESLQSNQNNSHQIRTEMLVRAEGFKTTLLLMLAVSFLLIILAWVANWKISSVNKSLELAVGRAEEAVQAKALFLSSMSHEFRTPLNAISGYSHLILMSLSPKKRKSLESYADAIDQSITNLVDMVDQVLELDHLLHRDESLILDRIDAREMLKSAIKLSARHAFTKQVSVHQNFTPSSCLIETDRGMFTQIIICLISNAIKFNHSHGEVWINCSHTPGKILITVEDSGIGIPRGKENLLFIPFERLGRESGIISGGGTGLSICKQICERLGVEMGYEHRHPEGSTFWISTPCHFFNKPKPQNEPPPIQHHVLPSNENRRAN